VEQEQPAGLDPSTVAMAVADQDARRHGAHVMSPFARRGRSCPGVLPGGRP
jgi:hypothetical protein